MTHSVSVVVFARWHLHCFTVVIIAYFWINVPHQLIMFAKLLYLMLVSFHYNSPIIVNDGRIKSPLGCSIFSLLF